MKGKCLFTLAWVALVSIALSVMVDAEGKHEERMNINDGETRRDIENKRSKTEHSLFPRVCGYHSWVVCGRRRRSSSTKVNCNTIVMQSCKTVTQIKLVIYLSGYLASSFVPIGSNNVFTIYFVVHLCARCENLFFFFSAILE